jgi:putative glutamine amidotransferase
MKPVIGLSSSYSLDNKQYTVPEGYIMAVERSDAVPIILPPTFDADIEAFLGLVNGIILTGGVDVDSQLYGENPIPLQGSIDPLRDSFELALTKAALKIHKPIFAICRGIQLLNVAAGGTLYQDINGQLKGSLKHRQQAPTYYPTHKVRLKDGSRLHGIFSKSSVGVNTFHHQAVKDIAPDFRATAWADDDLIEAIEWEGSEFIVGVQWHPERMIDGEMLKLFEAFTIALKR